MLIRKQGAKAYVDRLKTSRPYLDFLLDRAAARHDLTKDGSRRAFLNEMLTVAATIPDAATRDQFADRLSVKARITEGVVRDEIRKTAAARKTEAPAVACTNRPDVAGDTVTAVSIAPATTCAKTMVAT